MVDAYGGDLTSGKDLIRFTVGDKVSPFLLTDAEISSLISIYGQTLATVKAAWAIAAILRDQYDKEVGPLKPKLSQRWTHAKELAERLQQDLAEQGGFLDTGTTPEIQTAEDAGSYPDRMKHSPEEEIGW